MSRMLSISELCDITGKGDKTIRKKLESLEPLAGPKGAKLYDSKRALSVIYTGADDLNSERALLTNLQAQKAQIEIDELKGELIPAEVVREIIQKEYSIVRSQLLSIPSRLAKQLELKQAHEVYEGIRNAITETLTELTADDKFNPVQSISADNIQVAPTNVTTATNNEPSGMGGQP